MLLYIPDQILEAVALVIAGTLVMDIAKGTLNRVRLRAVSREEQQLKAGVYSQPALDRLRLVNTVVVHAHVDFSDLRLGVQPSQMVQQRPEQRVGLARAHAMDDSSGGRLQCPGQVVFLILAGRYELDRLAFGHPLIADLGQQVNVEFVGTAPRPVSPGFGVCGGCGPASRSAAGRRRARPTGRASIPSPARAATAASSRPTPRCHAGA